MHSMAIQWDELKKRHDELAGILSSSVVLDHAKRQKIQKEFSALESILSKRQEIQILLSADHRRTGGGRTPDR